MYNVRTENSGPWGSYDFHKNFIEEIRIERSQDMR